MSIPPLTVPHTHVQTNANINVQTSGKTDATMTVPPLSLSIPPLTVPVTNAQTNISGEVEEAETELEDLIEGMEWDTNAEIDLKTALVVGKVVETSEIGKTSAGRHQNKHRRSPPPPVIEYTYTHMRRRDIDLLKSHPSPFGAVVAEFLDNNKIAQSPPQHVIWVPFSIFQFDTPSPDEEVEMAKNDPTNPSRYKLITVDRMTKR